MATFPHDARRFLPGAPLAAPPLEPEGAGLPMEPALAEPGGLAVALGAGLLAFGLGTAGGALGGGLAFRFLFNSY